MEGGGVGCWCNIGTSCNESLFSNMISDHRIEFNMDNLHTPTSHEQIVQIIEKANEEGRKVRVVAAGHSWSEIAQTQDIMISLHKYTGIVEVDKENLKVTVKAGTSLRSISEFLDKEGLAMINLGSVAAQSLGGAISTGEHDNDTYIVVLKSGVKSDSSACSLGAF